MWGPQNSVGAVLRDGAALHRTRDTTVKRWLWLYVAGPTAGVYLAHILTLTGVVHPSVASWVLGTNMMMWSPLPVSAATALADPDDLPAIAYLGFAIAVLGWWFAL